MRSAFALRINSGKNIFICSSETPAGVSELLFHREGSWREAAVAAPLSAKARRCGKRPRPLRLLTTFASTSPKGRGLGKEMKFAWTAKGSPFGRAGALAPERARVLPTKAHIPKTALLFSIFLTKNKSGSPRAVRLILAFNRFYSSTSSLSKKAMPKAPGPVWVPMTQPIWRTSGASRCRLSCR